MTGLMPGNGENVIDETTAATLKPQFWLTIIFRFNWDKNIPVCSSRIPHPVIVSGDGMPYLWIDGVYGRDTNAAGNSDSSILVLNPKTQTRLLGY
jgi:hypothetical protein